MHEIYEDCLFIAQALLHAFEHTAIHPGHIRIIHQLCDDRREATNP